MSVLTETGLGQELELSFRQTLPRELAHRRALAEVFVTDSASRGENEFYVAIQIPRAHLLWSDHRLPFHDPLVTVEAARQATFVGIHRYLEVPLDLPGSLQRIEFRVTDLEAFRDSRTRPLEAVFRARVADAHRRDGQLVALGVEGELVVDGAVAMTLSGGVVIFPRRDYEVLRAHVRARKPRARTEQQTPARPLAPNEVGRTDERNVVIGESPYTGSAPGPDDDGRHGYRLILDEGHPTFYDHPQDHVPGPLVLEAYRQAAIATAHRASALPSPVAVVTGCSAAFVDYGEPDAPVECVASIGERRADGSVRVEVSLWQHAARISAGDVELTPSHER
jgi:hypothetical protein